MYKTGRYSKTNYGKIPALLIAFCLCLLLSSVFAQGPSKIEHYSTEEGLSHDVITCIFKDSEGYMWFGTWYGLNRFDGQRFTSYKSMAGDSAQLRNNRIDQITEDQSHQLWIKAYDGQIYLFSKKTERFRSLAEILNLKTKVTFKSILSVNDGALWVSTMGRGIICVPDVKTHPSAYIWYKKDGTRSSRLPSNKDNFFYKDSRKNFWIGTDKGLAYFARKPGGLYQLSIQRQSVGETSVTCVEENTGGFVLGHTKVAC